MNVDVTIIGGGLAGAAFAAALRGSHLSIALIEGRAPVRATGWDARIYAISPANAAFLERIGCWRHLDAERLQRVERMAVHGDAGGYLEFSAYDSGVPALAHIVESSLIHTELWEGVKRQANLRLLCPARPSALNIEADAATVTLEDGTQVRSRLVVAADGADSWTRASAGVTTTARPYGQLGVVANFESERPHHGTAWQWFRPDGVLAWLPLPGARVSMVWSTAEAHGRELLALDADQLAACVADAGGAVLGRLRPITPAAGFPLRLMRAEPVVRPRLALIGDAAHAIHPLSGHGINLGFQDAADLARLLSDAPAHIDCGDLTLLRRHERARKGDVIALQTATDALHKLFSQNAALLPPPLPSLVTLRNIGLDFTQRIAPVKDLLVRFALAS